MNDSRFWRCFFLLLGASFTVAGYAFANWLVNFEAALAVVR